MILVQPKIHIFVGGPKLTHQENCGWGEYVSQEIFHFTSPRINNRQLHTSRERVYQNQTEPPSELGTGNIVAENRPAHRKAKQLRKGKNAEHSLSI